MARGRRISGHEGSRGRSIVPRGRLVLAGRHRGIERAGDHSAVLVGPQESLVGAHHHHPLGHPHGGYRALPLPLVLVPLSVRAGGQPLVVVLMTCAVAHTVVEPLVVAVCATLLVFL